MTGATGFVGSAFARHAVEQGAEVLVLARPDSDPWRLAPIAGRYEVIEASLSGLAEAPRTARPPRALVHFAAAGVDQSVDDVDLLVGTNVVGTRHVLKYALRVGVERLVIAGSSAEYGPGVGLSEDHALRPTSEYGATRAAATLLAQAFGRRRGLEVTVVRPFSVYGPYEAPYRLMPYAILRGLRGMDIDISSGVQTRDYVHVDDVARGVGLAAVHPSGGGEVFNLCTGVETSVRDAAALAARLTGGAPLRTGVRAQLAGEMWRTSGDPRRAEEVLGWVPHWDLPTGLARTVEWFRTEGHRLAFYQDADPVS